MSQEAAAIRAQLGHPVLDSDGRLLAVYRPTDAIARAEVVVA